MRTRNSPELAQVLAEAQDIARTVGQPASSTHLLLALFTVANRAQVLLRDRGIDEDVVLEAIARVEPEAADVVTSLLERAHVLAGQAGMREVEPLHVLIAILRNRQVAAHTLLMRTGLDLVAVRTQAMSYLTSHMPRRLRDAVPARETRPAATEPARGRARAAGTAEPARRPPPEPARHAPPEPLRATLPPPARDPRPPQPPPSLPPERAEDAPPVPLTGRLMDPAPPLEVAPPEPLPGPYELDPAEFPWLSGLGRNLTQLAHDGRIDPLVGRERELEEVIDILGKRRANNPVLVGEPGVGKTAIVEGLAARLLELQRRAGPLHEKLVVEIDMASVLAGTHLRGSFSEKLNGIKDEVRKAEGRVIVFIDEIHTVVGAGATGDGPQDAANELKAALARGEFPCVGATTHDEYRRFIESDPALERRFTPVRVDEPSQAEALRILQGLSDRYAEHHGVAYEDAALEAAVSLSARYVTDRCLPDKAVGLLDLTGSRARREGRLRVGADDVARVVAKLAGVPEERLRTTDRERLLHIEEALSARLVGHAEIVARAAQVIRRNYAGFDSRRPMGSFLFLGPTGVGKTELAKALAAFLHGSESALVRIDMSEFGEPHTVARLIGAPPGYVGYGEGGQLTEPVRRRPFSVVLLDEVEKAHRDVLQLLLQVLDEGHLTDGRGRRVTFSNTLVILTSNLGSETFEPRRGAGPVGFRPGAPDDRTEADGRAERVLQTARAAFPPELWNRIDERLVFQPLGREEVAAIAFRLAAESSERLFADRRIRFVIDDAVVDYLVAHGGFDATLGARPMRQTLQRLLEAPLAERLLAGAFTEGDTVRVSVSGDALDFVRHA